MGTPTPPEREREREDLLSSNVVIAKITLIMFDSCCGGARGPSSSGKNTHNNTKNDDAFVEDIDEQTDGISLGNGWQRWVDFEERRYYYSKGGTTTWDAPTEEETREEKDTTTNGKN